MRQPEVGRPLRLLALALAVLLVVPAARAGWSLVRSGAFIAELLSDGALRPLSGLTPPPLRRRLATPGATVDRYQPTDFGSGRPLVLVHGFAPRGKSEPRVRQAATLLARAGFDVAVPTIPGLTAGRLRPADAEAVVAALAARREPAVVVAVSVGAGPAFLAAADPRVRDRVRAVVSLGGYASGVELLRFFLTGDYSYGDVRGHVEHDPAIVRAFLAANGELIDDSARRLLAARDPLEAEAAVHALSPELRGLLDALSPLRVVHDVAARVVLIHGRADPSVPYTESLRLAAARPQRTSVVLVGVMAHVEGVPRSSRWAALVDGVRLWGVMYRLLAER